MQNITKPDQHPFWKYWRNLDESKRKALAKKAKSSINTLRQIPNIQVGHQLAIRLEKETGINRGHFRPDIWPVPVEESV